MSEVTRKPVRVPTSKFTPSRVEIRQNSEEQRPVRLEIFAYFLLNFEEFVQCI